MADLNKMGKVVTSDVLILGAGFGGLIAALKMKKLKPEADILCLEKGYFGYNGQSTKAGHGMLHMSPEDDIDAFCQEQVEQNLFGQYLNDQDFMYETTRQAYDYIHELEELGLVFAHEEDGSLHYHREFAIKKCSAVNIDLDIITSVVRPALESGVRVMERICFTDILKKDGKAVGAVGFNIDTTEFYIFRAKVVVLATSDFNPAVGGLFYQPGNGLYAAFEAGAEFRNIEHATYFDLCYRNTGNLVYGLHWVVCNSKGENIFFKYQCKDFEDIEVAFMRGMYQEIKDGNGPLYVDFSQLPDTSETEGEGFNMGMLMPTRLDLDKFMQSAGGGPRYELPQVSLVTYLLCRALRTDAEGRTCVPGLWALGMMTMCGCAHGSWVHGDGVGYAARTALALSKALVKELDDMKLEEVDEAQVEAFKERVYAPYHYTGTDLPYQSIHYMYRLIAKPENSALKDAKTIREVLDKLAEIKENFENIMYVPEGDGHHLMKVKEAWAMVNLLELMYTAYDMRKESRGYHMRTDYPERDDENWIKWIVARMGEDGKPVFGYERIPLETYKFKPEGWKPEHNQI